jgi:hypothetical protein
LDLNAFKSAAHKPVQFFRSLIGTRRAAEQAERGEGESEQGGAELLWGLVGGGEGHGSALL